MRKKSFSLFILLTIGIMVLGVVFPGASFAVEPKPGDVIDKNNIEQYKEYFNNSVIRFIKDGWGMSHSPPAVIHVRKAEPTFPPQTFNKYTEQNKGKVKLRSDGGLENYRAGFPFPDPEEPNMGLKIAWNVYYRWRGDDFYYPTGFISSTCRKGGAVSYTLTDIDQLYFTNRTAVEPIPELPNPNKLHWAMVLGSRSGPSKGMRTLVWRYSDPLKADDMWNYMPTLRRTLRLVSTERANPVRGTPTTWDDFYGFDGKILEFDWTFDGEGKFLLLMHQQSFGETNPDGWQVPFVWGKDDPYELRDCYIITMRSKDPRHPESKRTLWVPKDIYYPAWGETFDKAGRLWKGQYNGFQYLTTDTGDKGEYIGSAAYWEFKTLYWFMHLLNVMVVDGDLDAEDFQPGTLAGF